MSRDNEDNDDNNAKNRQTGGGEFHVHEQRAIPEWFTYEYVQYVKKSYAEHVQ